MHASLPTTYSGAFARKLHRRQIYQLTRNYIFSCRCSIFIYYLEPLSKIIITMCNNSPGADRHYKRGINSANNFSRKKTALCSSVVFFFFFGKDRISSMSKYKKIQDVFSVLGRGISKILLRDPLAEISRGGKYI